MLTLHAEDSVVIVADLDEYLLTPQPMSVHQVWGGGGGGWECGIAPHHMSVTRWGKNTTSPDRCSVWARWEMYRSATH